jgi:hypothetical protein
MDGADPVRRALGRPGPQVLHSGFPKVRREEEEEYYALIFRLIFDKRPL